MNEPDPLFNYISTEEEAAQQKNIATSLSKGVFLLHRKFSRGFDIKFAQDAIVVVFDPNNNIPASEIVQMIGRASRAQGD